MPDTFEHALLIVKPDGVRHPEFSRILDRRLAELSLLQVATRDLLLSRSLARTFWRDGDVEEYIAYLREGPSRAIVVRGRQASRVTGQARSRMISWAALCPGIPEISPPGCWPAPHR